MHTENRILRLEADEWTVTLQDEKMPKREAMALGEYFKRIGIPYRVANNLVSVSGNIPRERIFPAVEKFYKGRAEVVPF